MLSLNIYQPHHSICSRPCASRSPGGSGALWVVHTCFLPLFKHPRLTSRAILVLPMLPSTKPASIGPVEAGSVPFLSSPEALLPKKTKTSSLRLCLLSRRLSHLGVKAVCLSVTPAASQLTPPAFLLDPTFLAPPRKLKLKTMFTIDFLEREEVESESRRNIDVGVEHGSAASYTPLPGIGSTTWACA